MYCPACGQSLEAEAGKCTRCGAALYNLRRGPDIEEEFGLLIPVHVEACSMIGGYVALFGLLLWFLGPVALVLGIVGLRRIRSGRARRGIGRAWTAIVLGSLESAAMVFFIAMAVLDANG